MTELLEHAVDAARKLPPSMQDELARVVLAFAGEEPPLAALSLEEEAAALRSRAAAARGEFATSGQVRAVWTKRGL